MNMNACAIGEADVARLVERPSALFAYVGQYLNLSCKATGDPSPTSALHASSLL